MLLAKSAAMNCNLSLILSRASSAALLSCCGVKGGITTGGGGGGRSTPWLGRSGATENKYIKLMNMVFVRRKFTDHEGRYRNIHKSKQGHRFMSKFRKY